MRPEDLTPGYIAGVKRVITARARHILLQEQQERPWLTLQWKMIELARDQVAPGWALIDATHFGSTDPEFVLGLYDPRHDR